MRMVKQTPMKHRIDVMKEEGEDFVVMGWAVGSRPEQTPSFCLQDESGRDVDFGYIPVRRDSVSKLCFGEILEEKFGFEIRFPFEEGRRYILIIEIEGRKKKIRVDRQAMRERERAGFQRLVRLRSLFNREMFKKSIAYLKKEGPVSLVKKIHNKIRGINEVCPYSKWFLLTMPDKKALLRQRKTEFAYSPLFSVVIPVFSTPEHFLRQLLDSLLAQTYGHFEVCLADASPDTSVTGAVIDRYRTKDARIRYKRLESNGGISANTNEAIGMAAGDFIVLCDHDDTLTPNALYEFAKALNDHPKTDCLYSDEDKMDAETGELYDPHFKPDFNIDLLLSVNYICHLFAVRRELALSEGLFDSSYDGAQDYDFILRMTAASRRIHHVPKVLYHWRAHMDSTAANPQSKLYAYEAGARAIKEHYKRRYPSVSVSAVEKGEDYGIYKTSFSFKEEPLISVIIPSKDHREDLDVALRSLHEKGTYKNLEFIIVENNSTEKETFSYYEELQKKNPLVRVVYWEKEFNYSSINNFGAREARGDYLLFMNNDVELIAPDSLYDMLGYVQREDVGVCGCRLLYEDESIQHAGVVVGFGGIAGHAFIGLGKEERSYFNRAMIPQDYSAVTAACMLVKREVFKASGGFSPELAVAFNDIDFCMKVRRLGKLVVYNPHGVFFHYESKSRGYEDTPAKIDRFNREIAVFLKKWPEIIAKGDPYYNPNLTLRKADFSLRDLSREGIGEPYHIRDIERYM